jgi:hypothetical protein
MVGGPAITHPKKPVERLDINGKVRGLITLILAELRRKYELDAAALEIYRRALRLTYEVKLASVPRDAAKVWKEGMTGLRVKREVSERR